MGHLPFGGSSSCKIAIRQAFVEYMDCQPDGDIGTFLDWARDELLQCDKSTAPLEHARAPREDTKAVPLVLTCPALREDGTICGRRHIDRGEFATKPHHTHACQHCGHVWRPAVVATIGVQFLPGFKDP